MLIERQSYINQIKNAYHILPVTILIGCRQVGKTSLLYMIKKELKHIFLNGQDPEISILFESVSSIETYLRVNLNEHYKGFVIIDEFQYLNNISTIIKVLTDKHSELKFICSGSSSLDIMQKVKESLAGRVRVIEIYSLSWPEYIMFNNQDLYQKYLKLKKDEDLFLINNRFRSLFYEYLVYGGFPRLATVQNYTEKINLLNDIYKTYLLRDVRNYIKNEDSIGFNKMLRLLALQIGQLVNINELSKTSGLPYKKTEEYLWLLEQMYIIKLVEPFISNKRKSLVKMRKIFFTELGLRNIIAQSFNEMDLRNDAGSVFENYIFLQLKSTLSGTTVVNYFRTIDGFEIDFIINDMKKIYAVEAKFKDIQNPSNNAHLRRFIAEEKIQILYIVNKALEYHEKSIHYILPAQLEKYFTPS